MTLNADRRLWSTLCIASRITPRAIRSEAEQLAGLYVSTNRTTRRAWALLAVAWLCVWGDGAARGSKRPTGDGEFSIHISAPYAQRYRRPAQKQALLSAPHCSSKALRATR